MDFTIADPKGTWFYNTGEYPYNDPESNTLFQPKQYTKALATEWLKAMPMIEEREDPNAVEEAAPAPKDPDAVEEAAPAPKGKK